MKSIINQMGFKEITIIEDCDFEVFYVCAKNLKKLLNIAYKNQLHDFDSLYWDFDFMGSMFTIHYNVFVGINIFPEKGKQAAPKDNEILDEIFELIKDKDITSKHLFQITGIQKLFSYFGQGRNN